MVHELFIGSGIFEVSYVQLRDPIKKIGIWIMFSKDFCLQKEQAVCMFSHMPVVMPCVEQL